MSLQLNLEKSKSALVLNLQKAGIMTPPALEVGIAMDVSYSFDDEHREGITDSLLTRLVPWGLTFDPDKKLDVFTFSDSERGVHELGSVDASNYFGYLPREFFGVDISVYPRGVPSNIRGRTPGYNGATDYSYVIERMLKHFGWAGDTVKKAGFLGGLLGQKDKTIAGAKKRSLVIVITDGDNADKTRTLQILEQSEKRKDEVYFLFIGVSNQGSSFPFLERIGDKFGNTGFVAISDLNRFVAQSDDELNAALLDQELLDWLKG
jgi:hypothetical protein